MTLADYHAAARRRFARRRAVSREQARRLARELDATPAALEAGPTQFLAWCAMLLSVAGAPLVAFGRVEGWGLWITANTGWFAVAWARRDWPQVALWGFYLVTAVTGFVRCYAF